MTVTKPKDPKPEKAAPPKPEEAPAPPPVMVRLKSPIGAIVRVDEEMSKRLVRDGYELIGVVA